MLVVRLLWIATTLIAIAAGSFYVIEGSTGAWYVALVGVLPLFILIGLRAFSIRKKRGDGTSIGPGWFSGSGPLGSP